MGPDEVRLDRAPPRRRLLPPRTRASREMLRKLSRRQQRRCARNWADCCFFCLCIIFVKRIPKLFFGQMGFWTPGVPRPQNHTVSRNEWFFGLAAEGGKANKTFVSVRCVVLCLGTPGLQQNTWPKNTSGSLSLFPAVFTDAFKFFLSPLPLGGPGGGSGLSLS